MTYPLLSSVHSLPLLLFPFSPPPLLPFHPSLHLSSLNSPSLHTHTHSHTHTHTHIHTHIHTHTFTHTHSHTHSHTHTHTHTPLHSGVIARSVYWLAYWRQLHLNQEANFADHLAPAIAGAVIEVWTFGRGDSDGSREAGREEEKGYGIAK